MNTARSRTATSSSARTDPRRRRFLAFFTAAGLGNTLLPGVLWGQVAEAPTITKDMLAHALAMSGLSFTEEQQDDLLEGANQNLEGYQEIRGLEIPNDVSPPYYFSPLTPGMEVSLGTDLLRFSTPEVARPAELEQVAFWPVMDLAQLLRTRQVTSVELTEMYLARLHRYNELLNCVVTFLDDLAIEQARQADAEIAAGTYRGPLHGVPWGAKDIMAVKNYPTSWGSDYYKNQVIDEEASVVKMLREAGAVLLAKLATGELAQGDRWFGGQTKSPWNPERGSSGSSAGPGSATAAGLVGFAIGTETSGSILSPSARCGVTGLRPTFGRVSRHGVMALSWTHDRLGPMCRYAEDCALVMSVIAKPDHQDLSVSNIPFRYDAQLDLAGVRVGYIEQDDPDMELRAQDRETMQVLESLGVELVPVKIPDWTLNVANYGVESAAFFDELMRSGDDKLLSRPERADSFRGAYLIPAVEYLQSQRARMMMMMELAAATEGVDVYLAPTPMQREQPREEARAEASGESGRPTPTPAEAAARRQNAQRQQNATRRHSRMANSAGYPAVAVPNGFDQNGEPTSISFFGRPFTEAPLLALVKAYQDATRFYQRKPNLEVQPEPKAADKA